MLQPDKKTASVRGHRTAYREIGEGDPIIFAHGNPNRRVHLPSPKAASWVRTVRHDDSER